MNSDIAISFAPDSACHFTVDHGSIDGIDKNSAADWFNRQFDALGCKLPNPTGKIIMRNVVVQVAKAAGEPRFKTDPKWAELFAQNCAALFRQQNLVNVDVAAAVLTATSVG